MKPDDYILVCRINRATTSKEFEKIYKQVATMKENGFVMLPGYFDNIHIVSKDTEFNLDMNKKPCDCHTCRYAQVEFKRVKDGFAGDVVCTHKDIPNKYILAKRPCQLWEFKGELDG